MLNLVSPSIFKQQNYINKNINKQQKSYNNRLFLKIAIRGGGRLKKKLDNFYKMQAIIKIDIITLKKNLNFLKENPFL